MLTKRIVAHAVGGAVICAIMLGMLWQSMPMANAAPDAGFVFTAVGDLGGSANTDAVLTGIANSGAAFQLTIGDLSYGTYAPESAWCSYVQSKVGATFPFELVGGNHEMDGSSQGHINNFAQCLPDRIGNVTGVYGKEYYFDYENLARVIFISPNLKLDGETYSYNNGTARQTWLVNAIDGARSANIPWVIVAMHKNCISTGVKSCEIGTDLFNLLIAKNVDLILQGHDHNYQRSKQLALSANCAGIVAGQYTAACVADDGADNVYLKGAGSVLNIVGTGGYSLYGSNVTDTEAGYFARIVNAANDTARYGFLKVNVTATELNAQFVPVTAGTFTDSYSITTNPPPTVNPSPTPQLTTTTLIPKGASWKYLANGSNQGTAWRELVFDDSAWASGNAQLGYGDGDEATVIGYGPDPNNKYVTSYFRKTINVTNPEAIVSATLSLLRDDGAVIYVNGIEVARSNMPAGTVAYNTYASTPLGGADETTYVNFTFPVSAVQNGAGFVPEATNATYVIAVEVHQASATSTDVSFDLALTASSLPTPTLTPTQSPTPTQTRTKTPVATSTPTPVLAIVTIENTSPYVMYGGWKGVPDANASGGSYRVNTGTGQVLSLNFTGTSVQVIALRDKNLGIFQVKIDGVDKGTVDLYNASRQYGFTQTYSNLANKPHTLLIKVLGTKNAASTGVGVAIDAFQVGAARYEQDANAVTLNYWKQVAASGPSGGSYRQGNGGAVQFTFTGTSITWLTAKGPAYGQADIYIDGKLNGARRDLYASAVQWQVPITISNLTNAKHTIKIQATGTKNASSTGAQIVMDAFYGAITPALAKVKQVQAEDGAAESAETQAAISAFNAQAVRGPRIKITWTINNEASVAGFNVWRSARANGTYKQMNAALIAPQAAGAQYVWRDKDVVSGKRYFYRLEILRADGTREWSDTIQASVP